MKKCEKCGRKAFKGIACEVCGGKLIDVFAESVTSAIKAESDIATSDYCTITSPEEVADSSLLKVRMISEANENDSSKSDRNKFHRSPRLTQKVVEKNIKIDSPPTLGEKPDVNWLSVFLMPILSMSSAVLMAIIMHNALMLIYSLPITLGSIALSVFNHKKQTEKYQEKIGNIKSNYNKYMLEIIGEIKVLQRAQLKALCYTYPETAECFTTVKNRTSRLWERSPEDKDFLCFRIGTGEVKSCVNIELPSDSFMSTGNTLEYDFSELAKMATIKNAPVFCDLKKCNPLGITGNHASVVSLAKMFMIQITTNICYSDLQIVCVCGDKDSLSMQWARYLPHTMNQNKTVSYMIGDKEAANKLFPEIKKDIETRKKSKKDYSLDSDKKTQRGYLFVVLDRDIVPLGMEELLYNSADVGVYTIVAARAESELPMEARNFIKIQEHNCELIQNGNVKTAQKFTPDNIRSGEYFTFAHSMGTLNCGEKHQMFQLPKMMPFLDMFGASNVEELEIEERWKKNKASSSLETPIGIADDGNIFYVNLKEGKHGPHGLIAGSPGSGKSEWLLTYVLSMAVNFHPHEVSFVLIDYKGGGMSAAFEDPNRGIHLPHLSGTITNLDGSSVRRSLVSIRSEIERREKCFNDALVFADSASMNIDKYQQLYREHKVEEPMPHQIIIVDEFAELKNNEPGFVDELISIVQLGRALGIHLILATQKPSGVVNDTIRANTQTRVCLRVERDQDSSDVIETKDAATIKPEERGRFYFRVGKEQSFGQGAWTGANYANTAADEISSSLRSNMLRSDNRKHVSGRVAAKTQFLAVIYAVQDLAEKLQISQRMIWRPILPENLDIDILAKAHSVKNNPLSEIPIGIVDDPKKQAQYTLKCDFAKIHNMVVIGEPAMGKTTFINTILMSLCRKMNSEQLNFYILDYSSRMLKMFKPLPHCGAVLGEEDNDRLESFFKLINSIVFERKKLFSELEVDNYNEANAIRKIPLVLVIIDNIAALNAFKLGTELCYKLPTYMKECSRYGVQYIITASHLKDISGLIRQEADMRICLKLKDSYEYSEVLSKIMKTSDTIPPAIPGRGLCVYDDRLLEMQLAQIYSNADKTERTQTIKDDINRLSELNTSSYIPRRLSVADDSAEYEDFAGQFPLGRIPLGFSATNKKAIAFPLKQFSVLTVYIGNPAGRSKIMSNFLYAMKRENMQTYIIRQKENSVFSDFSAHTTTAEPKNIVYVDTTKECLHEFCMMLKDEVKRRQDLFKEHCEKAQLNACSADINKITFNYMYSNTTPTVVIFENLAEFCNNVDFVLGLVYERILTLIKNLNMYAIGFVNPGDCKKTTNSLFGVFNDENNFLFFGGQFDEQNICELPPNIQGSSGVIPYNQAIMLYNYEFYPLVMPCGTIEKKEIDPDDMPIF